MESDGSLVYQDGSVFVDNIDRALNDRLLVVITGGENPYTWRNVFHNQPGDNSLEVQFDGEQRITDGTIRPAYERNNNPDVPVGTVVTLVPAFRRGDGVMEEEWVFDYPLGPIPARLTTIGSPTTLLYTMTATVLTVQDATDFPGRNNYRIRIDTEVMEVTSGAGTTSWTVLRGVDGTVETVHADDSTITFTGGYAWQEQEAPVTGNDLWVPRERTSPFTAGTVDGRSGTFTAEPARSRNHTTHVPDGLHVLLWRKTIDGTAATTLVGNLSADATDFIVQDSSQFPQTPFHVRIEGEHVRVETKSALGFTVIRGVYGSRAVRHESESVVQEAICEWTFEDACCTKAQLELVSNVCPEIALSGKTVLPGQVDITAAIGTYQDTGLSVTLPVLGTYLLTADVRWKLELGADGIVGMLTGRFRDQGTSVFIPFSQKQLFSVNKSGVSYQGTTSMNEVPFVTTLPNTTINLYVRKAGATTFTSASILSDADGRSTLEFVQIATGIRVEKTAANFAMTGLDCICCEDSPIDCCPAPAAERDICLWPFSLLSPWNRPLGSGAITTTIDPGGSPMDQPRIAWVDTGNTFPLPKVNASFDPTSTMTVFDPVSTQSFIVPAFPSIDIATASMILQDCDFSPVAKEGEAWFRHSLAVWDVGKLNWTNLLDTGWASPIGTSAIRPTGASALGGLIRKEELSSGTIIPHALAIGLFEDHVATGFIAPATASLPGPFGGFLKAGNLLVIPQTVDLDSLGLSGPGLRFARALQTYGGYVVDEITFGTTGFYAESGADATAIADLRADLATITAQLTQVVTGGTQYLGDPLSSLAPPFDEQPLKDGNTLVPISILASATITSVAMTLNPHEGLDVSFVFHKATTEAISSLTFAGITVTSAGGHQSPAGTPAVFTGRGIYVNDTNIPITGVIILTLTSASAEILLAAHVFKNGKVFDTGGTGLSYTAPYLGYTSFGIAGTAEANEYISGAIGFLSTAYTAVTWEHGFVQHSSKVGTILSLFSANKLTTERFLVNVGDFRLVSATTPAYGGEAWVTETLAWRNTTP